MSKEKIDWVVLSAWLAFIALSILFWAGVGTLIYYATH